MTRHPKSFAPPFLKFLLVFLFSTLVHAAEPLIVPITIDGVVYSASLEENNALLGKLGGSASGPLARHYKGVLTDIADSWLRVSNIDGQWQGIASVNGTLQVVESKASVQINNTLSVARPDLIATPVTNFSDQLKNCGVNDGLGIGSALLTINAALPVDTVTYSSFCDNKVNGVCLIAELEFIFDDAFQTTFGTQANAQAVSLINIAEGYYLNDLNMAFDVITVEMLSSELFTASTDAATLLTDLVDKKAAGQIAFLKNNRALTHLVTGRNFDGATAGIAYVSQVCNTGASVGVSSVVGSGTNRIPLTAMVAAHELAHNFGSNHDGPTPNGNGCTAGINIMSPSLVQSATHFSACSISEIQTVINSATNRVNPASCFNFPVDMGIVADSGNSVSVNRNAPFSSLYNISLVNGYQSAAQLQIQGSISASGGVFGSVTANGNACTVSGGSRSYSCTVNSPGTAVALSVQGTANGVAAQLQLINSVSVVDANVLDLNTANNQLTQTITILDPVVAGITVTPAASLISTEGGATASFTVVLKSQPFRTVTINLSSSDTTEGVVSPSVFSFTKDNWANARTITVTGVDDNVVDGDINYNISFSVQSTDLNYNGVMIPAVALKNLDNDVAPPPVNISAPSTNTNSSNNEKSGAMDWWWLMFGGQFLIARGRRQAINSELG